MGDATSIWDISSINGTMAHNGSHELLDYLSTVLLQHGADHNIRNTDGKTALDLADPTAKAVLSGE
jgi:hypothetical protein